MLGKNDRENSKNYHFIIKINQKLTAGVVIIRSTSHQILIKIAQDGNYRISNTIFGKMTSSQYLYK